MKNMRLIDGHTILIGLMAYPIRHSMSPTMHNAAFQALGLNYAYLVFDIDAKKLKAGVQAIKTLGMRGSNISMPNKQKIIPYLDHLDTSAKLCHAVNTVVNNHGELTGYTTDGIGFVNNLAKKGHPIKGQVMTLAGAGGAGTPISIQSALDGAKEIRIFNQHDAHWNNAQRNVDIINSKTNCHASLHDLKNQADFKNSIAHSNIYCDATGVGMKPLQNMSLVNDPSWFHKDMVVFDTVYSPTETKLMKVAKRAGVKSVYNGLGMMMEQGAAAFKLWTGRDMPLDVVKQQLVIKERERHESHQN